jgi:hypothetical protein
MLKSEICEIVNSFLNLSSSPQGFLLSDELKGERSLLNFIIRPKPLMSLIKLCIKAVEQVDISPIGKTKLKNALMESEIAAKPQNRDPYSWSRRAMKAFSTLDLLLNDIVISPSPAMQAVAIISILCPDFKELRGKPELAFEKDSTPNFSVTYQFDLQGGSITVPADQTPTEQAVMFPFDFEPLLLRQNHGQHLTQEYKPFTIKYSTVLLGILYSEL